MNDFVDQLSFSEDCHGIISPLELFAGGCGPSVPDRLFGSSKEPPEPSSGDREPAVSEQLVVSSIARPLTTTNFIHDYEAGLLSHPESGQKSRARRMDHQVSGVQEALDGVPIASSRVRRRIDSKSNRTSGSAAQRKAVRSGNSLLDAQFATAVPSAIAAASSIF